MFAPSVRAFYTQRAIVTSIDESEEKQDRPIETYHIFIIKTPDPGADLRSWYRHDLVHH
jgi:hypothetical protein